jgi:benzoylformate decarboxylase
LVGHSSTLITLNAARDENTVIAHEWTSVDTTWDRFDLSRPGSLFSPTPERSGGAFPQRSGCS